MEPQNLPPTTPSKRYDMLTGAVIGVLQIPLLYYVIAMVSRVLYGFSFYIFIAVALIELILLRKEHPNMAKGIAIGTILLPFLFIGACILMGGGSNL